MSLIAWQDSYDVGVAQIDNDHRLLVSLINQLHDTLDDGQSGDVVGSVLNVLIEYTVGHFGREERLMEKAGYPGLAVHKAEHATLTAEVRDIVARYNAGSAPSSAHDILAFLEAWLTGHILDADHAYVPYVRDVTLSAEDIFASIGLIGENAPAGVPAG